MEIKLNNVFNTFENPILAYILQKIFDNAYKITIVIIQMIIINKLNI
jgi:hypothetical protein